MMSIGLDSADLELILKVFAAHPRLERVTLYGSRAKGTHRKGSDIDLVLSGQGFTERDLSRLEGELDDLLLPYTFDLSLRCSVNSPDLLEHIERVGKDLYINRANAHGEV